MEIKKSPFISCFDDSIELHKRHSRISFDEVKETDNELTVRVTQTRSPHSNHFNKEELEKITRDLYACKSNFTKELVVRAFPYVEPPSEIVTPDWIRAEMRKCKVSVTGLVQELGIGKSDISGMINSHKDMGIRTKSMFYYYFLCKNKEFQLQSVDKQADPLPKVSHHNSVKKASLY